MAKNKLLTAAAAVIAGALAFSACTPQPTATSSSGAPKESSLTVMWNQAFYAYNDDTADNNNVTNANVAYLTNDRVTFYDQDLKLQPNKSFASYEKLSDSPLTVKVTLADTATWSDGVAVSPADIILSYGAESGLFNTASADDVEKLSDPETGTLTKKNPAGTVYFSANSPSLALIKEFPVIEGKSVTYKYSKTFGDWETGVLTPGVAAHVVGKRALGIADPAQAADAVLKAFQNNDKDALSKISNVWNFDFNFVNMPTDKELVVGSGPYTITDLKDGQYLTATKNPNYKGEHKPTIDKITIRFIADPMASVQALQNGEVSIIQPQATADVLTAVQALGDVNVETGVEGSFEHLDLTFNNKGPFDPAKYGGDAAKALKVRQAFLHTVPRADIIDKIIKPLNPTAEVRESFTIVPGSPMYAGVTTSNGMKAAYPQVDIEKAKALLAEAGVEAPSVRILYHKSNTRRVQEFQLIKESAEKAGFKIVDNASDAWSDKLGDKTYDVAFFAWASNSTAITESDANYRTATVPNNFGGYSNKQVDTLFDELQGTTDLAKQEQLIGQIEKLLVDDAFGLSIFQFPKVVASSKKVQNVSAIALVPTYYWNFWEWKLA